MRRDFFSEKPSQRVKRPFGRSQAARFHMRTKSRQAAEQQAAEAFEAAACEQMQQNDFEAGERLLGRCSLSEPVFLFS